MRLDNVNFATQNLTAFKEPRYTVELSFDTNSTDVHYFTSHLDAQTPIGSTSTASVIANNGISGVTQKIQPDKGLATIGNINIRLVDKDETISTLFNTKLDIGSGLRGKRVRVYTSFIDEAWNDYVLITTQIIDSISFNNGTYVLRCVDVQRSERKAIFDLAKTTMSSAVTSTALLIPVYSVQGFELLEHGSSYSDAPSDFASSPQVIRSVLYIKIENEIIRCIGTIVDGSLGLSFVVDNDGASPATATGRGALNTLAAPHEVDSTQQDNARKQKVSEYVYLELPLPKLIYAILTGNLEGQAGKTLPTKWHLGISTSFVRLSDFTGIGLDWWDPADDTVGLSGLFAGLKKQDAKKFIETQLNLLLGAYNPIYSDGSLGLKRMTGILSGSGYVQELNENNVISYSELKHDMRSVLNNFQINWNWNDITKEYTRTTLLIDASSITKHGESKLKVLEFRGLDGQLHTEETLFNQFNSLRDRYSGPPLKLRVVCLPSLNVLEVGDIVRVSLNNVRDFNGLITPLDTSFEIQGVSVNWLSGEVALDLFASSQLAGALALGVSSSVLNDSFYTTLGTELKGYIDGLGSPSAFSIISGIGHITSDVTLPGADPATIYYYDAPLIIDPGVTVTITNTVDLRIRGHFTINGTIDGIGQGLAGLSPASEYPPNQNGTIGYIGSTRPGGGFAVTSTVQFGSIIQFSGNSSQAQLTQGLVSAVNYINIINNTTLDTLTGVPTNLRGTSGAGGGSVFFQFVRALGGVGGASGAGLITISRGASFGGSGAVNLSGADGGAASSFGTTQTFGGGGAGGAAGAWVALLDGTTVNIPDSTNVTTNQGVTQNTGYRLLVNQGNIVSNQIGPNSSFYQGHSSAVNPVPNFRTQFIPEDITAVIDVPINTVVPPTLLVLSSGDDDLLKALDGTIISRINVSWTASIDQNIGGYEVEFKLSSSSNWQPASNTINLQIIQIYIAPVQDGVEYDVRVRAINNVGVRSDWLTLSAYTVIGKLATPPDCDQFTVQRLSDGTRVFDGGYVPTTNAPTDFAGYEIRAALGNGLTWEALTPLHTGLITQLPFETNQLAAGSYTAGIKAVDTTGNYSTNAVLVDSTLGDPRIKFALLTVDFKADGFPDIKTNSWVEPVTGNLIATDQYTWANFATGSPIQTWADWLTWATNPNSPIIYESAAVNLNAILNVTPLVTVTSNSTSILIQESHSDDDITYTAFATAGSLISAQYIKIKITITNTNGTPLISAAQLIVDSEAVEELLEDLDTSTVDLGSPRVAGDIRLPVVKTYSIVKTVQITLQNIGAGWTWELIDKSTSGPRIKIYNASNVLSDATIDAFISGA